MPAWLDHWSLASVSGIDALLVCARFAHACRWPDPYHIMSTCLSFRDWYAPGLHMLHCWWVCLLPQALTVYVHTYCWLACPSHHAFAARVSSYAIACWFDSCFMLYCTYIYMPVTGSLGHCFLPLLCVLVCASAGWL